MAAEEIVSLRNESLAAQQQRLDLAKFKIVSIAVLGSIAIGTSGFSTGSVPYIIGLIPIVALYVDVISETKKVQFMAIGSFLNTLPKSSVMGRYEDFVEQRRDAFLKNYSYQYSTIVVSAGIVLLGIGRWMAPLLFPHYEPDMLLVGIEMGTGVLGVFFSAILNAQVKKKIDRFKDAVAEDS